MQIADRLGKDQSESLKQKQVSGVEGGRGLLTKPIQRRASRYAFLIYNSESGNGYFDSTCWYVKTLPDQILVLELVRIKCSVSCASIFNDWSEVKHR